MELETAHSENPKELLQQAWASRREKNPSLSLRSFARYLRISPGRLSEILSGKRKISLDMAERISERLALDPESRAAFIAAILKEKRRTTKRPLAPKKTDELGPEYRQLTLDAFHVISDWYHFAILNLRDCDDFSGDDAWISKRLNITVGEVRLALSRLERLGLIEWRGTEWYRTLAHLTTTQDVRSAGLRKGHKGILQRAVEAIDTVDVEDRDITNMTVALNPEKLPEAKAMLARFRRKFAKFMESGSGRTEVYTVAIQLFPLTELRRRKKV